MSTVVGPQGTGPCAFRQQGDGSQCVTPGKDTACR